MAEMGLARPHMTENRLILLVAAFIAILGNFSFFSRVLAAYPFTSATAPALMSIVAALLAVNVLLLGCLGLARMTKPVLVLFLMLSALAAYFMDSYGSVINADMLLNAVQTQASEVRDLLNLKLLSYVLLLGILPALGVLRVPLNWRGWRIELIARLKLIASALLVLVALTLIFGGFYASFVREHKPLRTYANPAYWVYSALRYAAKQTAQDADRPLVPHGTDARVPPQDKGRELIVLVVGETARADHFSLNGYARETNPRLRAAGAISFNNFWACGTSTAAALPCMFADAALDGPPGRHENLLDVLQHAGVNVLWLDNNSDSKGVALRVPYRNYRIPDNNPVCDEECRDEGMLSGLQAYIDAHPQGDILIVLHQMGNHGPAYYRRYPPAFEKFVPACHSNDLSRCSPEEITNAYDNAILYTDDFLGKLITLLSQNSQQFEAGMFYVSDHGESLGEGGLYLHGMPKAVAPAVQLHVPALMWFVSNFDDVDKAELSKKTAMRFSHDNLFHTVLGFMEIESAVYRKELDMLYDVRKPENE
jgi:lipid A ethanolaminephosphotransferase